MNWKNQLNYQYAKFGITEKLILANVVVFIIFLFVGIGSFLFKSTGFSEGISEWLILPSNLREFATRPWTLLTYAFMHAGFWHIFWNMIVLYFSGKIFLYYFSQKRLLNYYFLGALAGGVLFIAFYNLFPVFDTDKNYELLGASAAIMAILIGVTAEAPNMIAFRIFRWGFKLWWIAAFFIVRDLIMLTDSNPGGHIAHLGGATLGLIYTLQLNKGNDIGAWFERLIDGVVGFFSHQSKGTTPPFQRVYRNKKQTSSYAPYRQKTTDNKEEQQKKIDAILDKISKNGYDSLSKKEKEFLFKVGNNS